jgi:hypothetical protein
MFVTSIVEVVAPGIDNLLVVLVYQSFDVSELFTTELVIVSKFNLRLQPKLGLAVTTISVNMNPWLLA